MFSGPVALPGGVRHMSPAAASRHRRRYWRWWRRKGHAAGVREGRGVAGGGGSGLRDQHPGAAVGDGEDAERADLRQAGERLEGGVRGNRREGQDAQGRAEEGSFLHWRVAFYGMPGVPGSLLASVTGETPAGQHDRAGPVAVQLHGRQRVGRRREAGVGRLRVRDERVQRREGGGNVGQEGTLVGQVIGGAGRAVRLLEAGQARRAAPAPGRRRSRGRRRGVRPRLPGFAPHRHGRRPRRSRAHQRCRRR